MTTPTITPEFTLACEALHPALWELHLATQARDTERMAKLANQLEHTIVWLVAHHEPANKCLVQ